MWTSLNMTGGYRICPGLPILKWPIIIIIIRMYLKRPKGYLPKKPESWPGSVADISEIIRIAATGRANTPDLFTIMQIMGKQRVFSRMQSAADDLRDQI